MIITRQDPFSFRLQTGETIVNFQAEKSTLELKMAPSSDRASSKHLFIETPGEYEMEGVAIEGATNDGHIFYTIHWDDMAIGLGGTTANMIYDILLLLVVQPRGGGAKPLANTDARILIPFGEEKTVVSFLKDLDENPEEIEKLTIKKKDLPAGKAGIPSEGERKIVVLKPLKNRVLT